MLDADVKRIIMASANTPVSIPRGRGRRVVTLYEAQIRRLASGRVYGRAAVMDFIRLVHEAAACTPEPVKRVPVDPAACAGLERLKTELARLREASASTDATGLERQTILYYEMLIEMARRSARY